MRDKRPMHTGRRQSPGMGDQAKSRYQLVRELRAARRRIADLEAAAVKNARIQATQHQVLETIARGKPLGQALAALARTIEGQCPGVMASVLLLDESGEHLRHGAAPGLPESYNQAVDGIRIGPNVGSCGTAAYRGEPVVVADIETDPLWVDFRDLALQHGLRACWSQPIFSSTGEVLGTLAMYYGQPQHPTEADQEFIEVAAFLAGIAIERQREEHRRRQAERNRLKQAQQLLRLAKSDAVIDGDVEAFVRKASREAARVLNVERVGIWLFGDDRTVLRCVQLYELSADRHSSGTRLAASDFPRYFAALERGRTVAVDDALTNEATAEFGDAYLRPRGITSMLDAPIRRAGAIVGVVCHEHVGKQRTWTGQEQQFAASLADLVARELEADERRHAEKALRSAQEELLRQQWQATQQVEEQLSQVRDELVRQTRLATVGQVAAGLADDLCKPLLAIDQTARELGSGRHEGAAELASGLQKIRREVRAAEAIVSDLVCSETAKLPEKRTVPLTEAAREAFGRVFEGDAVRLRLDVQPDPFTVEADPIQFRQLLSNLLANAVEASGGHGEIRLSARRDQGSDILSVSDAGPGVPETIRHRIFEPLFTTKPRRKGLGLAVCRQIAEGHGGAVDLAEDDAPGARFILRLPRTS